MTKRVFALADCNNFYASCERVFNPKLNGRPVIVLSNNDGCIIARSNEVKALGIKMGEPLHHVRQMVERNNIQVFSANFTLYGDLSNRVMRTLSMFAPEVEIYSVDEAFMNFTGIADTDAHARAIRKAVLQWVKLPVSIGIAYTKTLAKVANHIAKKYPRTLGVVDLTNESYLEGALKLTPVNDVWGVGRQFSKKLEAQGIKTAYDLTQANDQWLMNNFSVVLMRTVYELRGIPCLELEVINPPKKNIMTSRSFGRQITEFMELRQAVSSYAARGAEKLRKEGLAARSLMVFIHTNKFRPWEAQNSSSAVVTLPIPTHCTHELIHYATTGLESVFKEGYGYHKAGVKMLELVPADEIQLNLLDTADRARWDKLMLALDRINSDYGSGSIRYGAEGTEKRWKMRQNHKSQRFTTCWEELPIAYS